MLTAPSCAPTRPRSCGASSPATWTSTRSARWRCSKALRACATTRERGLLTPEQLGQAVALRFGLEYVEILNHQIDAVAVSMVDGTVARRLEVLPIGFADAGQLRVAMANPSNVLAIDDLAMMSGRSIMPVVASREDILTAVGRMSSLEGAVLEAVQDEEQPTAEERVEL